MALRMSSTFARSSKFFFSKPDAGWPIEKKRNLKSMEEWALQTSTPRLHAPDQSRLTRGRVHHPPASLRRKRSPPLRIWVLLRPRAGGGIGLFKETNSPSSEKRIIPTLARNYAWLSAHGRTVRRLRTTDLGGNADRALRGGASSDYGTSKPPFSTRRGYGERLGRSATQIINLLHDPRSIISISGISG